MKEEGIFYQYRYDLTAQDSTEHLVSPRSSYLPRGVDLDLSLLGGLELLGDVCRGGLAGLQRHHQGLVLQQRALRLQQSAVTARSAIPVTGAGSEVMTRAAEIGI